MNYKKKITTFSYATVFALCQFGAAGCAPANAGRDNERGPGIAADLEAAISAVRTAESERQAAVEELTLLQERVSRVNHALSREQTSTKALIAENEIIKPLLEAAQRENIKLKQQIDQVRRYDGCARDALLQKARDRRAELDLVRRELLSARQEVGRLGAKLVEVDSWSNMPTKRLVNLLLKERGESRVRTAVSIMETDGVLRRMMPALSTPGIWAPGPMGSYQYQGHFLNDDTYGGSLDAVPHSLSKLTANNALQPTRKGLYELYSIAADPEDGMRPRWTNAYRAFGTNNGVWMGLQSKPCFLNNLRKLQEFLREYGRDLVTAGLLAP